MARKLDDSKLSAKAKHAGAVLNELQKAIRFFRLYPHEHPFCVQSTADSHARLLGFGERFGALELQIQREGVFVDDELVLRESEQSTDLSQLLHPEGVRELSIEAGCPLEELRDMVTILSAHYPEGQEEVSFAADLLTSLWRRDFASIEYKIQDQLSPTAVQAGQDEALAPIVQRIEEVVGELGGRGDGGDDPGGGGLDIDAFLAEVDERALAQALDDKATWATMPERAEDYLHTPQGAGRQALLGRLRDPLQGDTLGRAADVVAWGSARPDLVAREDVARFLAGSTLAVLGKGDLQAAAGLLERLPDDPDVRGAVTQRVAAPEALQLVVQAVSVARTPADQAAVEATALGLFERLEPAAAVQGVVSIYPGVESPRARRVLQGVLGSRLEAGLPAVTSLLEAPDERVAREISRLLAGAGRDSAAWRALQSAAHAQGSSRSATIARDVLDELTGEKGLRERLAVVLESPDRDARLAALEQLGRSPRPSLFDPLARLAHGDLSRRDAEEVDRVLGLLVAAGGLRAVRTLNDLADRRTGLLGAWSGPTPLQQAARRHLEALKQGRGGAP